MLALYLLRHAKSSWGHAGLEDRDRPLNRRGREAARRIGIEMRRIGLKPHLVLCSTAQRTRETLDLILPALERPPRIEFDEALYLADPPELRARLSVVSETSVLLIGHNPGIGDLASGLAGRGDPRDMARLAERYPTGTLTALRFDARSWAEIADGDGQLLLHIRPRELAEPD
ncbi:MAG: histidine phosphatase family protein [Alphaproteobacteria bacterium]